MYTVYKRIQHIPKDECDNYSYTYFFFMSTPDPKQIVIDPKRITAPTSAEATAMMT